MIQALGHEGRELERFAAESENYYRTQLRGIRYWAAFFPSMSIVVSSSWQSRNCCKISLLILQGEIEEGVRCSKCEL